MYRANLARKHRHESCPRSWTSSPSQPAQGAPHVSGLPCEESTDMRAPPQLDFVVWPSQPGGLPHVSGLPREESTDMWVSPQLGFAVLLSQPRGSHHVSGLPREESTGMRVPPQLDFVALLNQPRGPPCFGLTSRGGTGMTTDMSRVTAAAQLRRNY